MTRRNLLTGWAWILECIFLALAIGVLSALIVVSLAVQDESMGALRDRHPNVSVNSIIAILSVLLTGACMFVVGQVLGQSKWQWFQEPHSLTDFAMIDCASRGSWGSLLLLFRLRVPTLARVAAITTLVAIAVNPFAQNIIAPRECQIITKQETTIPTADRYDSYPTSKPRNADPSPGDFTLWGVDRYVAHADMKASAYSGVWGVSAPAVNGSTTTLALSDVHRRFPRYSTLGICHQCADVSSSIEKSCDTTASEDDTGVFRPHCQWSLPTGQRLHNYASSETYYKMMNRSISDVSINYAIVNSTTQTMTLPHVPGTFSNVTFLANTTSDPECPTNSGNTCGNHVGVPTMNFQTIAVECSLFPCARTYTTSIVDDSLVETEVQRTLSTTKWLDYDFPSTWRQGPYLADVVISPSDNCTWFEASYSRSDRGPFSGSCTFTASARFILSLGDFFWDFWNGTVKGRRWQDSYATNDVLDRFWGHGITNLTHIDSFVGGVADSMTHAIRRKGRVFDRWLDPDKAGQGKVTGHIIRRDTCLEVRWGWVAVPVAVVVATAVLLVWAIISSRTSTGQPVWKASTLPILLHGPDITNLRGGSKFSTLKEMEKEASTTRVKLSDGSTGNGRLEVARP